MGNTTSFCYNELAFPTPLNITDCAPGFYCPNITAGNPFTYPQYCTPDVNCSLLRLGSQYCLAQGLYEPVMCSPGHYCPNSSTQLLCEENTYCIRGSSAPVDCPVMSYCPAGTEKYRYYGGVIIAALIDLATVALFMWMRFIGEPAMWRARKEAKRAAELGSAPSDDSVDTGMELSLLDKPSGRKVGVGALSYASKAMGLGDGSGENSFYLSGSALDNLDAKSTLEDAFTRCNAGLRMDLHFTDLSFTLPAPSGKTILSGVTGRIRPGRVTAIMGPSGAGKTTFLNVLMGKYARTAGMLDINGKPDEMSRYKKILGYVPQDDVMIRELTVRENILYSARVRLPRTGWTDASIQRHVDAIIDVLGLAGCADTLAMSVSGGQRKRTNIAMEIAAAPAILFLDEPTSGLDSSAALEVAFTLKAIADLGLTVVAVIHQPRLEIFRQFDELLMLAPGGVTVYMGPQSTAQQYFSTLGFSFTDSGNPADDLLDFVAGKGKGVDGFRSRGDSTSSPAKQSPGPSITNAVAGSVASQLSSLWENGGVEEVRKLRMVFRVGSGGLASSSLSLSSLDSSITPKALGSIQERGPDSYAGSDDQKVADAFDPAHLAEDQGASYLQQMFLAHNRAVVQQYRTAGSYALEMGVCLLAGGVMGAAATAVPELYIGVLAPPYTLISPSPIETLLPSIGLYVALAIGLAGAPAGVKTFGEEKDVFYREAASGHSRMAYYVAKSFSQIYRFTLGALHFTAIFHLLAAPATDFTTLYVVTWCQFFAVYGLAALTSMVVARENSALLGVIAALIAGVLCGFGPSLTKMREWNLGWLLDMSHARWASEAFFHFETLPYRNLYLVEEVSAPLFGYTLDRPAYDYGIVITIGLLHRLLAFILLVGLNRDKQR